MSTLQAVNDRRHPPSSSDNKESESDTSSTLYDRSALTPLTVEQQWAIISFYKDGQSREEIAQKISTQSITWIHH